MIVSMKVLDQLLDRLRQIVRRAMDRLAIFLNRVARGRLTPDAITLISLFAHLPIAWLIGNGFFLLAAPLLALFGLLDALDGAMARLQKKASAAGMLLDATTDRMKEIFLYTGIAFWFVEHNQMYGAVWAVMAIGGSLLVSYVKAKGETAVAGSGLPPAVVNRLFQDGLVRFEVRMTLLILGLLAQQLLPFVIGIALLSWMTAISRLIFISRKLRA